MAEVRFERSSDFRRQLHLRISDIGEDEVIGVVGFVRFYDFTADGLCFEQAVVRDQDDPRLRGRVKRVGKLLAIGTG